MIQEASGGCGRHVLDLVSGLDPNQFDITLMYGKERADAYYLSRLSRINDAVTLVPSNYLCREINPFKDINAYLEISHLIRKFKPDIVHCHSSKAGVLGRLAAMNSHVPKIFYTPHAYSFQADEFSKIKKEIFIELEKWLSHHATTCTFNVSLGEKKAAIQAGLDAADKFAVIHNGLPPIPLMNKMIYKEKLGFSAHTKIVGVSARMAPQKDPATFLKIAKRVTSTGTMLMPSYVPLMFIFLLHYMKVCRILLSKHCDLAFRLLQRTRLGIMKLYKTVSMVLFLL